MAKRTVDYGTRQVEVEVNPAVEEETRAVAANMGAVVDNAGRIMVDPGKAPGRNRDPQFEARMASMRQRFKATGIQPATVVNFLPIPLTVNSPMQSMRKGVPAPKSGTRYAAYTWNEPEIVVLDRGEQGREPQDFHPMQFADAFVHEYPQGGVVALACSAKDLGEHESRLKEVEEQAVRWMQHEVAKGDVEWNRNKIVTSNTAKRSAQRLLELKIIHRLPDWVNAARKLDEVPVACDKCGKTPEVRNAVQCVCGYILDPERAYQKGVISEEDTSLERLTRAKITELGITAYVAETVDEKPERLKAGLPRPLSEAAMRAMAAEERYASATA